MYVYSHSFSLFCSMLACLLVLFSFLSCVGFVWLVGGCSCCCFCLSKVKDMNYPPPKKKKKKPKQTNKQKNPTKTRKKKRSRLSFFDIAFTMICASS